MPSNSASKRWTLSCMTTWLLSSNFENLKQQLQYYNRIYVVDLDVGPMTLRMWVWPRGTIPSSRCLETSVLGITSRRRQYKWHGRFLPLSWAYRRTESGSVYLKQMMMHTTCGRTRYLLCLSYLITLLKMLIIYMYESSAWLYVFNVTRVRCYWTHLRLLIVLSLTNLPFIAWLLLLVWWTQL